MFIVSNSLIEKILLEDIPYSDTTSEALGITGKEGMVECFPKADGFVSGIELAAKAFEIAGLTIVHQDKDGTYPAGHKVLVVKGAAERIHSAYKTAQNLMEYSSGIANRVQSMLKEARPFNPHVQVAVTRKHFPGAKFVSLYAALSGGAIVHRAGLSESILIFDQHRVFCDDFEKQLVEAKHREPEKKIAVEVDSIEEGLKYVRLGADIIQLERFPTEDVKQFVQESKAINPAVIINVAGGINNTNAAAYAATGADVLVTSWVYFGKPFDIKMKISAA